MVFVTTFKTLRIDEKFLCRNNITLLSYRKCWSHNIKRYRSVATAKVGGRANLLTLSEQQYFVWDTASQGTKWQDMFWNLGAWLPWPSMATPMHPLHQNKKTEGGTTSVDSRIIKVNAGLHQIKPKYPNCVKSLTKLFPISAALSKRRCRCQTLPLWKFLVTCYWRFEISVISLDYGIFRYHLWNGLHHFTLSRREKFKSNLIEKR